ncbi:MAG: TIGR03936 family radical SAM-associated protein [Lachnospiraceae bacterium]|nr:TIGR03936 family radical SAM-associated protein [Lachnospiraceae bacterium]
MQESSSVKYRIKFSKNGAIKYIGHLDVMRYFQKVIRRSGLPVKYSEGYSPHQLLSFAFPLSVGYTSDGEYFDMALTDKVNEDEIKARLNDHMDQGILIEKVKELPEKAGNCMSLVFAASYKIRVKEKISLGDDFKEKTLDFLSQETIPVNKPKKKGGGFVSIDLKEYLYDYKFIDDRTLYICVNAGSETNIKPSFVMETILGSQGMDIPENPFMIHRVDIYENVSEDAIELRPLI